MTEPMTSAAGEAPAASSYCCECGTYDAHVHVCTCCGFDFRGDAPADQAD